MIMQRGRRYYKQGRVRDFEEVDEGNFEAQVEGSEVYEAAIRVEDGLITAHTCDCPYFQR